MYSANKNAESFKIFECSGFKIYVENESVQDIVKQALEHAVARKWHSRLIKDVVLLAQARPERMDIFALATTNVAQDANSEIFYHHNKPYELRLSTINPQRFIENFIHEISHGSLVLANPYSNNINIKEGQFLLRLRRALCEDFFPHMNNRNNYVPIQDRVARLIFGLPHSDYPIEQRISERICFTLQALTVSEKAAKSVAPRYCQVLQEYITWELKKNIKSLPIVYKFSAEIENINRSLLNNKIIYPCQVLDPQINNTRNIRRINPVIDVTANTPTYNGSNFRSTALYLSNVALKWGLPLIRFNNYLSISHTLFNGENESRFSFKNIVLSGIGTLIEARLFFVAGFSGGIIGLASLASMTPDLQELYEQQLENMKNFEFLDPTLKVTDQNLIFFDNPWGPMGVANMPNPEYLEGLFLQLSLRFINDKFQVIQKSMVKTLGLAFDSVVKDFKQWQFRNSLDTRGLESHSEDNFLAGFGAPNMENSELNFIDGEIQGHVETSTTPYLNDTLGIDKDSSPILPLFPDFSTDLLKYQRFSLLNNTDYIPHSSLPNQSDVLTPKLPGFNSAPNAQTSEIIPLTSETLIAVPSSVPSSYPFDILWGRRFFDAQKNGSFITDIKITQIGTGIGVIATLANQGAISLAVSQSGGLFSFNIGFSSLGSAFMIGSVVAGTLLLMQHFYNRHCKHIQHKIKKGMKKSTALDKKIADASSLFAIKMNTDNPNYSEIFQECNHLIIEIETAQAKEEGYAKYTGKNKNRKVKKIHQDNAKAYRDRLNYLREVAAAVESYKLLQIEYDFVQSFKEKPYEWIISKAQELTNKPIVTKEDIAEINGIRAIIVGRVMDLSTSGKIAEAQLLLKDFTALEYYLPGDLSLLSSKSKVSKDTNKKIKQINRKVEAINLVISAKGDPSHLLNDLDNELTHLLEKWANKPEDLRQNVLDLQKSIQAKGEIHAQTLELDNLHALLTRVAEDINQPVSFLMERLRYLKSLPDGELREEKIIETVMIEQRICNAANKLAQRGFNGDAAIFIEELMTSNPDLALLHDDLLFAHQGQIINLFSKLFQEVLTANIASWRSPILRNMVSAGMELFNTIESIMPNSLTLAAQGLHALCEGDTSIFKRNANNMLSQISRNLNPFDDQYEPCNETALVVGVQLLLKVIEHFPLSSVVSKKNLITAENIRHKVVFCGNVGFRAYSTVNAVIEIGKNISKGEFNPLTPSFILTALSTILDLGYFSYRKYKSERGEGIEAIEHYRIQQKLNLGLGLAGGITTACLLSAGGLAIPLAFTSFCTAGILYKTFCRSTQREALSQALNAAMSNIDTYRNLQRLDEYITSCKFHLVSGLGNRNHINSRKDIQLINDRGEYCLCFFNFKKNKIQTIWLSKKEWFTRKKFWPQYLNTRKWPEFLNDIKKWPAKGESYIVEDINELVQIRLLARLIIGTSALVDEYTSQCSYYGINGMPDKNSIKYIKKGKYIYITQELPNYYLYLKDNNKKIVKYNINPDLLANNQLCLNTRIRISEDHAQYPFAFEFSTQILVEHLLKSSWKNIKNLLKEAHLNWVYNNKETCGTINTVRFAHLHERLLQHQKAQDMDEIIKWTDIYLQNGSKVITQKYQFPPHIAWQLIAIRLSAFAESEEKLLEFRDQFQQYIKLIFDSGKKVKNWIASYQNNVLQTMEHILRFAFEKFIMAADKAQTPKARLEYLSFIAMDYKRSKKWFELLDSDKLKFWVASCYNSLGEGDKCQLFLSHIKDLPELILSKKDASCTEQALLMLEYIDETIGEKILSELDEDLIKEYTLFSVVQRLIENQAYSVAEKLYNIFDFKGKSTAKAYYTFCISLGEDIKTSLQLLMEEEQDNRHFHFWKLLYDILRVVQHSSPPFLSNTDLNAPYLKLLIALKFSANKILFYDNDLQKYWPQLKKDVVEVIKHLDLDKIDAPINWINDFIVGNEKPSLTEVVDTIYMPRNSSLPPQPNLDEEEIMSAKPSVSANKETTSEQTDVPINNTSSPATPSVRDTKADGDCAFHAIFGIWDTNSKRFDCNDVVNKRKTLAKAMKKVKEETLLFKIVEEAIGDFLKVNDFKEYKNIVNYAEAKKKADDEETSINDSRKLNLISELRKTPDLVNVIKAFIKEQPIKQSAFERWLKTDDGKMYFPGLSSQFDIKTEFNLIEENPCLKIQIDNYKNMVNREIEKADFDLWRNEVIDAETQLEQQYQTVYSLVKECDEKIVNNCKITSEVIGDYATYIQKQGSYLCPSDIHILSYVYKYKIDYYAGDKQNPDKKCTFNDTGKQSVAIYYADNHFERMATQDELTNTNQNSASHAMPSPPVNNAKPSLAFFASSKSSKTLIARKSDMDNLTIVDKSNWALTLISVGFNHTEIVIEGMGKCLDGFKNAYLVNKHKPDEDLWAEFDGAKKWTMALYLTGKGDLKYSKSAKGSSAVILHNITGKSITFEAKTLTYSLPPKQICNMLLIIQNEIKNPPKFSRLGHESLFTQGIVRTANSFFSPLPTYLKNNHNCISWAKKMLGYTSLYKFFPLHNNDLLFTTARSYTDKESCLIM